MIVRRMKTGKPWDIINRSMFRYALLMLLLNLLLASCTSTSTLQGATNQVGVPSKARQTWGGTTWYSSTGNKISIQWIAPGSIDPNAELLTLKIVGPNVTTELEGFAGDDRSIVFGEGEATYFVHRNGDYAMVEVTNDHGDLVAEGIAWTKAGSSEKLLIPNPDRSKVSYWKLQKDTWRLAYTDSHISFTKLTSFNDPSIPQIQSMVGIWRSRHNRTFTLDMLENGRLVSTNQDGSFFTLYRDKIRLTRVDESTLDWTLDSGISGVAEPLDTPQQRIDTALDGGTQPRPIKAPEALFE